MTARQGADATDIRPAAQPFVHTGELPRRRLLRDDRFKASVDDEFDRRGRSAEGGEREQGEGELHGGVPKRDHFNPLDNGPGVTLMRDDAGR